MSEPTIEQMNEAIALFMGMERVQDKDDPGFEFEWLPSPPHSNWCFYHPPPFDRSWDWLMPVVEKIETPEVDQQKNRVIRAAADVEIYYKACVILYSPDEESGDTNEGAAIHSDGETKLEAVHKTVYNFIQWYNKQKEANNETDN